MILILMFFVSRISKYIILKKLRKQMDLLDWGMLIDITMFVLGILTIMWTIDIREVLVNIIDNGGSSPVDILK